MRYFVLKFEGVSVSDGSSVLGYSAFQSERQSFHLSELEEVFMKDGDLHSARFVECRQYNKKDWDEFLNKSKQIIKQRELKKEEIQWIIQH